MKETRLRIGLIIVVFVYMGVFTNVLAQYIGAAISSTGALPNANAMLDVQSPQTGAGKGLLIPRVTYLQRVGNNTTNLPGALVDASGNLLGGEPAQGLLVYQTDAAQGFYYNTSTSLAPAWVYVGSGDFMANGSVAMTGSLDAGGHAVSNAMYYGNGVGLTGIPASGITEADPLWAAASNAVTSDISSRLLSSTWSASDSTTNYTPKTEWETADSTTNYASRVDWVATNAGLQAQIDSKVSESSSGGATLTGSLNMSGNSLTNVYNIDFSTDNVQIGAGARSYSTLKGSVALGAGATARYRTSGVAIGTDSDGDYNGIALGYSADGQYTNIAIGFQSSAYSGYDRIAIGRDITNRRNDSVVVRGTMYLDGGTGVLYRKTVGVGGWTVKAFTIDHPLDPENKVLRHYCMESPDVWNVYAGNAEIVNGRAEVLLPEYYSALNRVGSEVYSLTPVGGLFDVGVGEKVTGNRFVILGEKDGEVSWTIKVLRNDPACLEDLKQRPVEQFKDALSAKQRILENGMVNTGDCAPKDDENMKGR